MNTPILMLALGATALPAAHAGQQTIARAGEQASQSGPEAYFTGRVRIDPVWPAEGGIPASGGLVTFEPGARSAWHTHPAGHDLLGSDRHDGWPQRGVDGEGGRRPVQRPLEPARGCCSPHSSWRGCPPPTHGSPCP